VFPCWWNPSSHIYTPVSEADKSGLGLYPLDDIISAIAHLCGLDLFSTEIAYTSDGLFVVVDYVNDQIDLRLQSSTIEGVPDAIVKAVADQLATHVVHHSSHDQ
jgi:hypothetical protein